MKQVGFGLVEGLLIVIVLSIVGFGGWYMITTQTQQNNNNPTTTNNSAPSSKSTANTSGKITVNYSIWEKVPNSNSNLDKSEPTYYKYLNGTGELEVYDNNPIITYSSNAPVYCRYESASWVNYSAISSPGLTYSIDKSSDACKSIKTVKIEGHDAYVRFGGAQGQTTYFAVISYANKWFVFRDFINWGNGTISDKATENLTSELITSVGKLVSSTLN